MGTTAIANTDMAAAWDGPEGEHWTVYADRYERVSSRHWARLLERVRIESDAAILDIGCGTGASTREAARIASAGSALGIDLSASMLEHARAAALADGLTNVGFEQGDAQVHPFRSEGYTVALSVFGAMFFADPVGAFANIRRALRPGGTLALLAWRELASNDWLVSFRQALAAGRTLPEPPVSAPGPFGLADPAYVRRVLAEAGFADISVSEVDEPMEFGRDVDEAFEFVSGFGITKGLTSELDDKARAGCFERLHRVIHEHDTGSGVLLGSAAWLITAS